MSIAFDASSGGGVTSAASVTIAHTCTGSNLVLIVAARTSSNVATITGITYNGVSMSQVDNQTVVSSQYAALYILKNPATGANNIIVSASGTTNINACAASYTGVNLIVAQPVATNKTTGNPPSLSLNTTNDNAWIIAEIGDESTTIVAGSAYVNRSSNGTGGRSIILEDSNGAITPIQSKTVDCSFSGGSPVTGTMIALSLAPLNNFTRTLSDSVSNGSSRFVTISRSATYIRSASDSVLNAAFRLAYVVTAGRINLTSFRPSLEISKLVRPLIK